MIPAQRRFAGTRLEPIADSLLHTCPEVEELLSYRSIDVSTLKELAKRWNPKVASSAPVKAGGHRALDDINESLIELRHYRSTFTISAPNK